MSFYRDEKIKILLTAPDKSVADEVTGMVVSLGFSPLRGEGLIVQRHGHEQVVSVLTTDEVGKERISGLEYIANIPFERIAYLPSVVSDEQYTVLPQEVMILCNPPISGTTIYLPSPQSAQYRMIFIKKVANNNNLITVTTSSGTIDGSSQIQFSNPYGAVIIYSDGNNWWVVGQL